MASLHSSRLLFEDDHLLIVNKLPQELVVKAPGKQDTLPLYDFLLKDHPGLKVVHRLDFGTSGVIVFAKSKAVQTAIRESKFKGWRKSYRGLAAGKIRERKGSIDAPIPARGDGRLIEAHTEYTVLRIFDMSSDVALVIESGRKHQIRRHLQHIGHPLLNDPIYGNDKIDKSFRKKYGYRRFFLHASAITFPHPVTGESITVSAPLPKAYLDALERME